MINSDKFSEIRSLLGEDFQNLVLVYTNDTRNRCIDIQTALEEGDLNRVRELAHAMKSSSANIGADQVSKLAADIEKLAGAGRMSEISGLFPSLQKAIDDAIEIMNN